MTKETTPPPQQSTAPTHEPPSLPASPLAKRTKPDSNSTANTNKMTTALPPLLVKKLTESAQAPSRGSAFAAGYDLYSAKETVIPAKGKALVDTGLAIAVPEGTSLHRYRAGVIDADYRGEVKVLLFNFSDVDFTVKVGDRIAQLVLERIYTPEVMVVEELEESVRGAGGFGSTGL
ncbi:dUTP diphosphatase [Aspergillus novofumigatus IBT 16806]|uniref:Deoxyuridine 5'-triphosphate nucleotidohydrolase n=1 Tax=Aspergillus novofumigatus (strain IBT 16806) TaxID=1392255 RepID=A0A2I1BWC9_ASPN1|nr:dUTP diphosphatase [Aspergillus novofumigatus IBT 16806]PKX89693.1 dUTP diphosphatase [Aspergillus novofumigatus IBT 16806]